MGWQARGYYYQEPATSFPCHPQGGRQLRGTKAPMKSARLRIAESVSFGSQAVVVGVSGAGWVGPQWPAQEKPRQEEVEDSPPGRVLIRQQFGKPLFMVDHEPIGLLGPGAWVGGWKGRQGMADGRREELLESVAEKEIRLLPSVEQQHLIHDF